MTTANDHIVDITLIPAPKPLIAEAMPIDAEHGDSGDGFQPSVIPGGHPTAPAPISVQTNPSSEVNALKARLFDSAEREQKQAEALFLYQKVLNGVAFALKLPENTLYSTLPEAVEKVVSEREGLTESIRAELNENTRALQAVSTDEHLLRTQERIATALETIAGHLGGIETNIDIVIDGNNRVRVDTNAA